MINPYGTVRELVFMSLLALCGQGHQALAQGFQAFPEARGNTGVFRRNQLGQARARGIDAMSWSDAETAFKDPESICQAVRARVEYKPDDAMQPEWKAAEETWNTRTGDCEDFALAVQTLSRQQGSEARIYVASSKTLYGSNAANAEAHAVAIGTHNGRMWVSSNGSYAEVANFSEARDLIAREQGWWFEDVKMEESSIGRTASQGPVFPEGPALF